MAACQADGIVLCWLGVVVIVFDIPAPEFCHEVTHVVWGLLVFGLIIVGAE